MTLPAPETPKMEEKHMDAIDEILFRIRHEVVRARRKHAPMHSPHEGYAVIQEEVDELWEEVKADEGREGNAITEAVQIAAMAVLYVADLQINPQVLNPDETRIEPEKPCSNNI